MKRNYQILWRKVATRKDELWARRLIISYNILFIEAGFARVRLKYVFSTPLVPRSFQMHYLSLFVRSRKRERLSSSLVAPCFLSSCVCGAIEIVLCACRRRPPHSIGAGYILEFAQQLDSLLQFTLGGGEKPICQLNMVTRVMKETKGVLQQGTFPCFFRRT
jgi:hypothetical protein